MQVAQNIESSVSCPTFSDGRKLMESDQARLWIALKEDSTRPSRQVFKSFVEDGVPLDVSVRHINRLRQEWGLSRVKGRPRTRLSTQRTDSGTENVMVTLTPHLSFVGVHLFSAWMESHDDFEKVMALLQQAIESYTQAHPEADFPLLHHKHETLQRRFKALFYAPLLGISKLTELDVAETSLISLVGVGYHSSTLNQFLGQLEKINAGHVLQKALLSDDTGSLGYVDGHMIAYWTRKSMHKGKITMIGRIMAGSQAMITHNEHGHALAVQYYPPDIRMPHFIVEYCRKIAQTTTINVFVIDREVNSVELARKFEENDMGLLSMLDKNEYDGLSSWTTIAIGTLKDGSIVYEGQWAKPRENDPRHFVLVETGDRVLPYWGTPKVKELIDPMDWPKTYGERTKIQEYRFKEMKAHGALDVNYGTKTIPGADRHQQRACDELTQTLENAHQKIARKEELIQEQHLKVAESLERGHTTRLGQRKNRLDKLHHELDNATQKRENLTEKLNSLGEPRERSDRDFRKQTIMTIRTLLLENALLAFLAALCAKLQEPVSLECLLKLLFDRSAVGLETNYEIIYKINSDGLSAHYKRSLRDLIEGMNAMSLNCRGKPIRLNVAKIQT